MRSIRRTLIRSLLIGLIALVGTTGLLLHHFVRSRSVAQFDRALAGTARAFAGMMEREPGKVELEFRGGFLPEYERTELPEYYQIWTESGDVIERSRTLNDGNLPRRGGSMEAPEYWDLTLPDGRAGRAIGVRFLPEVEDDEEHEGEGEREREETHKKQETEEQKESLSTDLRPVTLVLARSRTDLNQMLQSLLIGILFAGALTCAAMALLVSRTVRRGLLPLARLAGEVEEIDSHSLDSRLSDDGLPRELKVIAKRLNALLERLQRAFAREKRLTADIAHELKTPLAELRALSEVYLKWPDDPEFLRETLTGVIEVSKNMDKIVGALLSLARCESGRQPLSLESVQLSEMVDGIWDEWREQAVAKGIDARFDIQDSLLVRADRVMMTSILTNLFSNAVEYSPSGGRIDCRLAAVNGTAAFSLSNTAESLTEKELSLMFEPLWRKDPARGGDSHCGLGLPLTRAFAKALGIEIQLELTEAGAVEIKLHIPRNLESNQDSLNPCRENVGV